MPDPDDYPDHRGMTIARKILRARVSKQLMNYPLARDIRTAQPWRRSKPIGTWWLCALPGDPRIEFRLRGDTDEQLRHCPTPFEVNVLLLVLAQAEQLEQTQISFASDSAMLRELKIGIDSNTRRRLRDALCYWCELDPVPGLLAPGRWRQEPDNQATTGAVCVDCQGRSSRQYRTGSPMVRTAPAVLRQGNAAVTGFGGSTKFGASAGLQDA